MLPIDILRVMLCLMRFYYFNDNVPIVLLIICYADSLFHRCNNNFTTYFGHICCFMHFYIYIIDLLRTYRCYEDIGLMVRNILLAALFYVCFYCPYVIISHVDS